MGKGVVVRSTAAVLVSLATCCALMLGACTGNTPGERAHGGAGRVVRIGIVTDGSDGVVETIRQGFVDGLAEAGYSDGERLRLQIETPNGDAGTLPDAVARLNPQDKDLVLAISTPAAEVAASAVSGTPLLFAGVHDPVGIRLVTSLDLPGGEVTGVCDVNPVAKQLELVKEIRPGATRVGIIHTGGDPDAEAQVRQAEEEAAALGLEVRAHPVGSQAEVRNAAETLDADAFLIPTDDVVTAAINEVIEMAEARRVLVVASEDTAIEAGAAAAHAVDHDLQGREAAALALRILEGAKPGDLPVAVQESFELVINEPAAERMGFPLPPALIERADEAY